MVGSDRRMQQRFSVQMYRRMTSRSTPYHSIWLRISGETAPLLFTAFGSQYWNSNITQPMASVPVVMNQFAGSPYESWQTLAWAGALVLTIFVLLVSLTARGLLLRNRISND